MKPFARKTNINVKAHTFTILPNKVFQKLHSKSFINPDESPEISIELIKKGKLTKSMKYYAFFNDRCLFYKVEQILFFY